jgi:glucose/arabinose dehydrogenase
MRIFSVSIIVFNIFLAAFSFPAVAGSVQITPMATGLDQPWAIGFLPDGGWLITLRGGQLRHYQANGEFNPVNGVPKVAARGQGGLLDVVVARDFAQSRTIFLSYSKKIGSTVGTALASAVLSTNARQLEDVKLLFQMKTPSTSSKHFGGRIVEAPDGALFLTLGERGDRPSAQDLSNHNGTVIRVRRDGSLPNDNPKIGGLPEIWSFGHRNPQGAALDARGRLVVVEHGARGGDEVNYIKKGANYGWPIIAYGRHYTGGKIGVGTHNEGMEQPSFYWDPSIAPSGFMIYSGELWSDWKGDFFVGSLKFDYISRLEIQRGKLREVEQIKSPETARVRDVRQAPDGSIWFLSVDKGTAFRMVPAGN